MINRQFYSEDFVKIEFQLFMINVWVVFDYKDIFRNKCVRKFDAGQYNGKGTKGMAATPSTYEINSTYMVWFVPFVMVTTVTVTFYWHLAAAEANDEKRLHIPSGI